MRLGKPNNTGTPVHDDLCDVAAGYIRNTGVVAIVVSHRKQPHMLILTPEDLEKLAAIAREKRASMERENAA